MIPWSWLQSARNMALVGLAALAAPALGGCGDGSQTTTVTETTTAEASTSSTESSTSTSTPTDGETPAADREVTELTQFATPSGNIGCVIEPASVRCDIAERDFSPPKSPSDCKLDYGQGIALSAGGTADFVCAGDTTLGAGETLEYGQSIAAGLLVCESAESGVSCRDVESGRGFELSRESYELF